MGATARGIRAMGRAMAMGGEQRGAARAREEQGQGEGAEVGAQAAVGACQEAGPRRAWGPWGTGSVGRPLRPWGLRGWRRRLLPASRRDTWKHCQWIHVFGGRFMASWETSCVMALRDRCNDEGSATGARGRGAAEAAGGWPPNSGRRCGTWLRWRRRLSATAARVIRCMGIVAAQLAFGNRE